MSPRRRVRATELARNKKDSILSKYFILLLAIGGLFLFFMIKWTAANNFDRFASAKQYSEYYKEYFVEYPVTYNVFDDQKLVVRATNLGYDFWNKEFRGKLKQSENEVNEMLKIEEWINTPDANNGFVKQKVNLSSFPDIFDLIKQGREISEKTLYNIAAGEIFDFWEISLKNYKIRKHALEFAKRYISYLYDSPLLSPLEAEKKTKVLESLTKEKTKIVGSVDSVVAKIKAFGNEDVNKQLDKAISSPSSLPQADRQALLISILQAMEIYSKSNLPKNESMEGFFKYVNIDNIEINEAEKSILIKNINTGIKLSFFKEALFLKKLKEKLPKDNFNYLIFLGDRHGMWRLPPKYIRWTVSIDDPFAITDKCRGAVKLLSEEGYFVVTRKNEEIIIDEMPEVTKRIRSEVALLGDDKVKKNEYFAALLKEFPSKNYIFDPTNMIISKKYDLPVDWRTGQPVEKNLTALVLDTDPVRARMYSYSLFISDKKDIKSFSDSNQDIVFAVLGTDGSVTVPDKWKELFFNRAQVEEMKKDYSIKMKGLNPDGSVPEKK